MALNGMNLKTKAKATGIVDAKTKLGKLLDGYKANDATDDIVTMWCCYKKHLQDRLGWVTIETCGDNLRSFVDPDYTLLRDEVQAILEPKLERLKTYLGNKRVRETPEDAPAASQRPEEERDDDEDIDDDRAKMPPPKKPRLTRSAKGTVSSDF